MSESTEIANAIYYLASAVMRAGAAVYVGLLLILLKLITGVRHR